MPPLLSGSEEKSVTLRSNGGMPSGAAAAHLVTASPLNQKPSVRYEDQRELSQASVLRNPQGHFSQETVPNQINEEWFEPSNELQILENAKLFNLSADQQSHLLRHLLKNKEHVLAQ